MQSLKPYFNGCAMLNSAAAKDEAVIAALESLQARGWPASSGFGTRQTWRELIGSSPRFNS